MSCKEWGIDPAEEIEDPWLAHQLRIGLMWRMHDKEQKAEMEQSRRADHLSRLDAAKTLITGRAALQ